MADPISITGLVFAIGGLTKALVNYAADIRDARKEIQNLTTELFALKGVLEHIGFQLQTFSSEEHSHHLAKYDSQEFYQMLESVDEILRWLSKPLKQKQSYVGRSVQRMTWSLKKEEVQKQITRIERVKTCLILVMTSENLSSIQDVFLEVLSLSKALRDEREQKEMERAQTEQEDFLQWLAPVGPEPAHSKACAGHLRGTNNWFLEGPLKQFLDSHPTGGAILWLKGKSGSGKTTLMAHVIEHLKALSAGTQDLETAYFYCSFDDLASQDPLNMLGSLAAQLASKVPQILEDYDKSFAERWKKNSLTNVSANDLMEPLTRHITPFSRVFICVDAVNESEKSSEVVTLLYRLGRECKNICLLISSTGGHSIHKASETSDVLEIEMRPGEVDRDIYLYIDTILAEDHGLKKFSEPLKHDIKEAVLARSNGMFRYAQWQMEHLAAQRTGRGARKCLSDMPQNLNESYERVLARIPTTSPDRALIQRTLLWLSFAATPLHLFALGEAIVLEDDDKDLDDDCKLHSPEVLIDLAQGLLDYDRRTLLVSLAHSSIKTFLTSTWIRQSSVADFALEESSAHRTLMRRCLTYLCFAEFKDGADRNDWAFERTDKYRLYMYAARSWTHHAKTVSDEDWKHIQAFLSTKKLPNAGNYGYWLQFLIGFLQPQILQQTSPLYYAASFGFTSLVKAILDYDESVNLDAPGGRQGSTALQVACFRKQREASRLLVRAGANPYSLDGSPVEGGLSAFFWAKSNGWEDILRLMKSDTAHGGQAPQRTYQPGSLAYALEVQERAVRTMED